MFTLKTMIINILIALFVLISCTNQPLNENRNTLAQGRKDSLLFQMNNNILSTTLPDTPKLIIDLYKDKEIIPTVDYSNFSYLVKYRKRKNLITIKSMRNIADHKVEYFIILKDTAGIYSEDEFSAFDDSYKYIKSYFKVDGKKIDLTDLKYKNLPNENLLPSLIWYDEGFGISCKYFKVDRKEFFLIRGLDLYCNGSQCTSYQVFVIKKEKRKLEIDNFYFSGLYPYDFENTLLFDDDRDGNPEIFIPNDIDELNNSTDFKKYEL